MQKQKVAIGLSGGVDSAVSTALLKDRGYEITGVFIICYRGPGCRTDEDRKDALDVALKLKIPFEVLDFRDTYHEKVLQYFKAEYQAGRTPNPDVVCNREIKFGLFYDWALRQKFDYLATGHYARTNQRQLLRSADEKKDQTYFLYTLREEQLKHIIFPIGGMTKQQVREEAIKRELPVAKKPDSQGICFIGEVSVPKFLQLMGVTEKIGDVINTQGDVIGKHKGVWFYTIGQRHGFVVNVKQPTMKPLFVVRKEIKENRLVVGTREECMRDTFEVGKVHWIGEEPRNEIRVRIRHGGELIPATLGNYNKTVHLEKPVFGVAAGQVAVFYDGEMCLGGGMISGAIGITG